jgi:hypothetical protein
MPAAREHTAAHVGSDKTHRVDQADANAGLRPEGEHRHGKLAFSTRTALRETFGAEVVPVVGQSRPGRAGCSVRSHIFVKVNRRDGP